MTAANFFSPDYGTARERFRQAAGRLGLALESHVIAARGPRGEALAIDVATLGPARCRQVLVLSSGLHGVEGFLGSAAQLAWLSRCGEAALPRQVKVVLVHALNPFGFAWLRRWNERNVDLNRNFLADPSLVGSAEYRRCLDAYERLAPFLNPADAPSRWEPYRLKAAAQILAAGRAARDRLPVGERPSVLALEAIWQLGLADLKNSLLVGQYRHRDGLFYGGDGPEETTTWLQARMPVWVAEAELALHIDFHSGLGRWAECKLLSVDRRGSPAARWAAERFGDELVEAADEQTAYVANGTMAGHFRERLGGGRYHGLTAEFGTYAGVRVLGALRAENRAHFHAAPESSTYRRAKRQLLEAFAPADTAWRAATVEKSLAIIARAIALCGGEAAAAAVPPSRP